MSNIAIRCEGLSKQYRIGRRERYKALRDVLTDGLSAPFRFVRDSIRNRQNLGSRISNLESRAGSIRNPQWRRFPRPVSPSPRRPVSASSTFWALDDVSFEIKHGEVVGIIGRNGANPQSAIRNSQSGILSRITEPTRGFAEINGRVGSLLEVGTGFHPELTGAKRGLASGRQPAVGKADAL